MARPRNKPSSSPTIVFVVSVAILSGAYFFQYVVGLAPCQLCFWQRYPYFVIIPLSLLAMVLTRGGPRAARALIGLCGLAYLVGAGIAGYHAGVEYHFWPGPETCTPVATTIEELLARETVVRCDEVPWSMLGISMAGYNFILSLLMAGFCLTFARRKTSR